MVEVFENQVTLDEKYSYEVNKKIVDEAVVRLNRRVGYRFAKRAFDIVASSAATIVLVPVWVVLSAMILADDPHGSPFFVQKRVGKGGKEFDFYKLRSMYVNAEERVQELRKHNTFSGPVFKMENDPRITKVGHFIRKWTLDETPQFLNVIKGDMSLVGPRPPVVWEALEYTPFQKLKLSVKPGLTCFWQVSSHKYDIDFDDYVLLDIKYMKEMGFLTDLKLIFKTVSVVLSIGNE